MGQPSFVARSWGRSSRRSTSTSGGTSQGSVSNCVSKLPARSTSWVVVPLLQVLWLQPSAQVVRSDASSPSKRWSNSSATGTCLVPRWTSSSPTTSAIQSDSRVKNWLRSKTIPMKDFIQLIQRGIVEGGGEPSQAPGHMVGTAVPGCDVNHPVGHHYSWAAWSNYRL